MLTEIIKFDFWFSNPGPSSLIEFSVWSGIFALFAVLGVSILLYNKFVVGIYPPKNKILKPIGIVLIVTAAVAELFVLFNWQGIDFMGVRAWGAAFILFLCGFLGLFSYKYIKEVPSESVKYETGRIKKKYI